jgi:four helix bundle protein
VLAVYRETHVFEKTETYGLRSQMRRAAVLVPAHIADGCYRGSDDEYRRLLLMSLGSASELEYLLLLSKDLGYLDEKAYEELNALVVSSRRC